MLFNFYNKKISSILTVLPENESLYDDEIQNYNFPPKKSLKLKELMGFNKHRLAPKGMLASDLAVAGLKKLFSDNVIKPEEIDALVYVTLSPDYFLPQTSHIIQHKAGLKEDLLCFDITQGCAGYIFGLIQAFMLLDNPAIKKVALVNSDILSQKVNPKDRNSFPLIGDAASVTIIERSQKENNIFCYCKTFGEGAKSLIIPAGGFAQPCTEETRKDIIQEDGNIRNAENLVMEGASVFSFVQEKAPKMVNALLESAKLNKEDIDYFMFHQPNKFMLEKLADKIGVSYDKLPNNIVENFGNASSVTIPTAICFNIAKEITNKNLKLMLAGFGVGLSIAGLIIDTEKLDYCQMMDLKG